MSAASEKLRMLANDLDWYNYDLPSEVVHTMRGIAAAMEDELNRMDRWHSAKLQAAMTENAKLRELVKRMFDRVNYECRCCSIFCSDWDEDNECCVFATSMRELGVEVDE